jgi:hypothetical protein
VTITTTEHPAHGRTLTHDDFENTLHGVSLTYLGEDCGERIVALGHVDKRRFLAAANCYVRAVGGPPGLGAHFAGPTGFDDAMGRVQHLWAINAPICISPDWEECPHYDQCIPQDCASDFAWYLHWGGVTESTPGAFRITLLDLP